jgi:hypothetical protein
VWDVEWLIEGLVFYSKNYAIFKNAYGGDERMWHFANCKKKA